MNNEKLLMYEAATLYYDKKMTQQEIAGHMNLSRQTVSKLLNDAIRERVVEIKIHNPETDRQDLETQVCKAFGIDRCVVCSVSNEDAALRRLMTVEAAISYLLPILQKGGLNIALSWGRTIQELIHTLPPTATKGNTVYPLFGETDNEKSYFSSSELARKLADKLGADVQRAWFPYMPEDAADYELLKQLSSYKKMQGQWETADIAILGIGNTEILEIFEKSFGHNRSHVQVVGDIATHFFDETGTFLNLYENTLRASVCNIQKAKDTVAIACGPKKAKAIAGALRTKLINTLITDEYTAREILEFC